MKSNFILLLIGITLIIDAKEGPLRFIDINLLRYFIRIQSNFYPKSFRSLMVYELLYYLCSFYKMSTNHCISEDNRNVLVLSLLLKYIININMALN